MRNEIIGETVHLLIEGSDATFIVATKGWFWGVGVRGRTRGCRE